MTRSAINFESDGHNREATDGLDRGPSTAPTPSGASVWAASPEAIQLFAEGLRRLEQAETGRAAICFEQAIEGSPQFADAHVALGVTHAVECRVYPALDHLHRAIELDGANFNAHFKLAQLYFKLRVPRKGYEEAQQALDCAASREHRQHLALLLRDERERSRNAVHRPTWGRPWSRVGAVMLAAAGLVAVATALAVYFHL